MRASFCMLMALCHLAYAHWLGQQLDGPQNGYGYGLPKVTATSSPDGVNGWSPKPTEAPFLNDGSEIDFVELMRRGEHWVKAKRQTTNWLNSKTCGWFDHTASEAFVCGASLTCSTNIDSVVNCIEPGATTPFYTVCLDYQAVNAGLCRSVGPQTGCCATSSIGACITYVWPGPEPKSMYLCHTAQGMVTMLDVPRSVLDASTRSTSTRSSSTTTSDATTGTTSGPTNTGTNTPPPAADNPPVNAGAIAGGVVGGVAGLALIAGGIAFFLIRRRNKSNNTNPNNTPSTNPAYTAVPPTDTSYASPQLPQNQPGFFPPGTTNLRPETPYLANQNDPRYSYLYDPSKPPEMQQGYQYGAAGGGLYPHTTPSPNNSQYGAQQGQGHTPPPPHQGVGLAVPGQHQPYQPYAPQQFMSELDSGGVVRGQSGNPAEMPGENEARR
ncbi:hypothetical protein B0T21DRAFT_409852 [Apiosordaria backusii]|uniref:Uncharacterized protein n=1 Tax=Apiosordaria backusii TaxID=314023 RepID=A0AA40EHS7_9PEZI|nr:hypothetical protein B0T21DRAFT_409852 [Apiosordaria backusii]